MPEYTANYNLIKPGYDETADIKVINENMNTIDGKLKENADGLSTHSSKAASTSASGHVQLQTTVDNSETTALTPKALNTHVAESASTSQKGHVQLSTSTTSTSTSLAATASAVKTVNDALTSHKAAAAPHSGHETPAGAQAKAEAAAGAVLAELDAHLAAIATQEQLGHVKIGQNLAIDSDGTLHAQASGGKKVARFVIGTSTAGWTLEDCDYLCDGTDDQEEIIQALDNLPATGGEVVILDGTYNITASINIPKDNVSIRGNGNATILKRMYNSTGVGSGSTARGLITLNEKSGCKIQSLQIDGNKATYTASYNYGIYLYSSSDNTVTGNTCNNNCYGIYLDSSSNNTVTYNTCNNNYNSSINLSSSSGNTVTGNTCNNNNSGIRLYSSSGNTVTDNTCIRGTGTPEDYTSSQYTIRLSGSGNNYNLISSNNCMGKAVVVEGGTGNSAWGNKYDNGDDLPI